jgi:hypothetical protein
MNPMKFKKAALIFLLILLVEPALVRAQDEQPKLQVALVRNYGYGGLGKIQGRFTVKIKDPPIGLESVVFYLDDEIVHEDGSAPFEYKFHTGDFDEGEHTIVVIGTLKSRDELHSEPISKIFISSEQAWDETQELIIPLILFTAFLTLLGVGVPILGSRKKDYVVGSYGPAGGAVCPRCELAFSRSIFSPNLLVGKLVRCPHCGKISLRSRASSDQLQEAEARYLNQDPEFDQKPEMRDFLNQLEESRFED